MTDKGTSAWPCGTLGFDNDLTEDNMVEFGAAAAALLMRHGRVPGGGGEGQHT